MRELLVVVVVLSALVFTFPVQAAVILTDSFDRPDANSLGSPWVVTSSTWGIRSGQARLLSGQYASTTALATVNAGSTQVSVEADITLSATEERANAGLALMARNYTNNLFCKIEVTDTNPNGLVAIGRRSNGTITSQLVSIRNAGLVNGGTYHVRCARSGDVVTMTVGNLPPISYTLSSQDLSAFGSSTFAGFRLHLASNEDDGRSTYDDLVISDGSATPTPTSTPSPSPTDPPSPSPTPPPPAGAVTVAAAGDICNLTSAGRARCAQTGDLIVALDPDAVLPLGDLAYESGTSAEFGATGGYRDAWGVDNAPSFYDITYPAVGNHEYNDPTNGAGAEGFRAEFASRGLFGDGNLYYSFDLGAWHLIALDTDDPNGATRGGNTAEDQPGIEAGSAQATWLSNELASDPHSCDLVYGHHPRYSSSDGGGSVGYMDPVWDIAAAGGVDIWLAGHDHGYERFGQIEGMRLFVVGTGGTGLNGFRTPLASSQVRLGSGNDAWGVLLLTLADDSYSWAFIDRWGTVRDQGGPIACH